MYKATKTKENYLILDFNLTEGYPLIIKKNKLKLFNQEMIDHLVRIKFSPELNELIASILAYLETDEGNANFLLGELEREHSILLNKYDKFISAKEKEHYMRNIRLLANELRQKIYNMTKVSHKRF